MSTLSHDLRHAVRMLRKAPLFTGVAIVTLALGIGLNTAVFSAIDALLLRPLPGVRQPDEMVQLFRTWPGMTTGSNSVPHVVDLRERGRDVFTGVAAWSFEPINLSSGGRTERVMGQMVTANFFEVLGAAPALGRVFVAAEDSAPGAHPVAVLSDATWRGMFGADPGIVGRAITLNARRYTVVGVMAPEFRGPVSLVQPAMWVPLMQIAQIKPDGGERLTERGSSFMNAFARLRPGVTPAQARDRMNRVVEELRAIYPEEYRESGIRLATQAEAGTVNPDFQRSALGLSAVVMAVVLMLLLIACVNVANLFLARARDRWREMAVRLSIGASRGQLVRQLLTESLVFAAVAGAAGMLIAWWAIALVNRIRLPLDVPIHPDLRLDLRVLGFSLLISALTGIIFGLAPALQATRPALVPALKGEAPAGGSRSRMSRGLVVAQMALSLMLLVSAGLFLRSLGAATSIDTGFRADNVLLAGIDPALQGYDRARTTALYRRLADRLRAMPQVREVGLAEQVPLGLGNQQRGVTIPGYTPLPDEQMSLDYNIVGPGYFEAMGIRLVRGSAFTAQDDSASAKAIIVNERFVERFWPGQDALGRTVRSGGRDWTVVGVVPTGKYRTLGEAPLAYMYFPQEQMWNAPMTLHVRTSGDPLAIVPTLRSELAAMDADLPLSDVRTMASHLGISLLPARLVGGVLGVFGLLGLILAAVGVYGVMSYSVAQRTREIGIRMAVGAARGQVVGLVVRQGLSLVAVGTAVGLVGAAGGSRLVRGLLYGGAAMDPVAFVGVPAVLIGVALLAIWIPARRAASVNPITALRSE